ncbi:MAG: phosphocholine cytidylyltransferase family protein [Deltaproteobacteria bacterium]|nr:phosphocholine cytidylyltransferase family protein [Deltaproteobacteria bacterium]
MEDNPPIARTAVILAAGMGTRLRSIAGETPKGCLVFQGQPLIERSLEALARWGVDRVVVVRGWQPQAFADLLEGRFQVEYAENPDYAVTGSMHSLFVAGELLKEDFLLLESDLLYEDRALERLQHSPQRDSILISGPTGAGDEVYVYGSGERIQRISKEILDGPPLLGELVGISRISIPLYRDMCTHYQVNVPFPSNYHYEDCLSDLSGGMAIGFEKVEDLAWTEIDDPGHYRHALENVYPRLLEKNARHRPQKERRQKGRHQKERR